MDHMVCVNLLPLVEHISFILNIHRFVTPSIIVFDRKFRFPFGIIVIKYFC